MAATTHRQMLQDLVSALPFPVWLADRKGTLVAASAYLGEHCPGAGNLSQILEPADTWTRVVEQTQSDASSCTSVHAGMREQGTLREVDVSAHPCAEDGLLIGWVTGADEADREWLTNQVAHALRNPIFAALVQTETIAMRAADDARLIKATGLLHKQLKRLEAHLNEMLLYGRPAPVQRTTVNVGRLLGSVADRYRRGLRGEPAQVEVRITDGELVAQWDPKAVEIILERVLDNAVQHSEAPHRIEIAASGEAGWAVITVRDHGEGIPENMIDQVMLPFYPQHRGRPGLGLAVAFKFAQALGGTLHIRSTPEQGTEVRCSLPLTIDP